MILNNNKLRRIGKNAFSMCKSLDNNGVGIELKEKIEYIGEGAFNGCDNIKSAKVLCKIDNIEKNLFKECTKLKDVTLNEDIKEIGEKAFYNCPSIEQIDIKNISSIKDDAFNNCSSLIRVDSNNEKEPTINTENTFKNVGEEGLVYSPKRFDTWLNNGKLYDYYWHWNMDSSGVTINPTNIEVLWGGGSYDFSLNFGYGNYFYGDYIKIYSGVSYSSIYDKKDVGANEKSFKILLDKFESSIDFFKLRKMYINRKVSLNIERKYGKEEITERKYSVINQICKPILKIINDTIEFKNSEEEQTKHINIYVANDDHIVSKSYELVVHYEENNPFTITLEDEKNKSLFKYVNIVCKPAEESEKDNIRKCTFEVIATLKETNEKITTGLISVRRHVKNYDEATFQYYSQNSLVDIFNRNFGERIKTNSFKNGVGLVSLKEPITSVTYNDFVGAEDVEEIDFYLTKKNYGLKEIGDNTFKDFKKLERINIFKKYESYDNTINKVGKNAFSGCTSFDLSTSISKTIKEIGEGAFNGCENLKEFTFNDDLTKIEKDTFKNCKTLNNILFSEKLIKIENCAFIGCISLTGVSFPNSIIEINSGAFYGCNSIESITIPNGLVTLGFSSYSSSGDTKYYKTNGSEIGVFENCLSLKNVDFTPNKTNLKIIGTNTFSGCLSLETVNFPEGCSVELFLEGSFKNCPLLNLKTKESNIGINIPKSIKSLGTLKNYENENGVFENSNLNNDFYSDSDDEKLNSLICIGENCFKNTKIKKFDTNISNDSIQYIGEYSFSNCNDIKYVRINFFDPYSYYYNINTFYGSTNIETVILKNFIEIPDSIFCGYLSLQNLTLGGLIRIIGKNAFNGCKMLNSIKFDDVIKNYLFRFGDDAFCNCNIYHFLDLNDNEIGFDYLEHLGTIGCGAFFGCNFKTIKLTKTNVFGTESYAHHRGSFANNKFLTNFEFGEKDNTVGIFCNLFQNCSLLSSITVNCQHAPILSSLDPITKFIFDGVSEYGKLIHKNASKEEYALWYEMLGIGWNGCDDNTKITIKGDDSINHVELLSGVTFKGENSTNLKCYAEVQHNGISDLLFGEFKNGEYIPKKIVEIPENAFIKFNDIIYVKLYDSIEKINKKAFFNLGNLKEIILNCGLKNIGEQTFSGVGIKKIKIPYSVELINPSSFSNCLNLEEIEFGDKNNESNLLQTEYNFVNGCSKLNHIIINKKYDPQNGKYAPKLNNFNANYSFKDVSSFGIFEVNGNYEITEYKDKDGHNWLKGYGISYWNNNGDSRCAMYVYTNKNILEIVPKQNFIKDNVNYEDYNKFFNRFFKSYFPTKLSLNTEEKEKIIMIDNINCNFEDTSIDSFSNCTNLTSIDFSTAKKLKNFGDRSFHNCLKLNSIKIPSTIISIGKDCFNNCANLNEITFLSKDNVIEWEEYTFFGITKEYGVIYHNLVSDELINKLKTQVSNDKYINKWEVKESLKFNATIDRNEANENGDKLFVSVEKTNENVVRFIYDLIVTDEGFEWYSYEIGNIITTYNGCEVNILMNKFYKKINAKIVINALDKNNNIIDTQYIDIVQNCARDERVIIYYTNEEPKILYDKLKNIGFNEKKENFNIINEHYETIAVNTYICYIVSNKNICYIDSDEFLFDGYKLIMPIMFVGFYGNNTPFNENEKIKEIIFNSPYIHYNMERFIKKWIDNCEKIEKITVPSTSINMYRKYLFSSETSYYNVVVSDANTYYYNTQKNSIANFKKLQSENIVSNKFYDYTFILKKNAYKIGILKLKESIKSTMINNRFCDVELDDDDDKIIYLSINSEINSLCSNSFPDCAIIIDKKYNEMGKIFKEFINVSSYKNLYTQDESGTYWKNNDGYKPITEKETIKIRDFFPFISI